MRRFASLALMLALGATACDDESWDPAYLESSAPPVERAPAPREEPTVGSERMPNLPAAPTAEQEAAIAQLVAQSRTGGGRGHHMPDELDGYDRFGRNAEGLDGQQAAALIDRVRSAGRNVLGQDVTPCDRLVEMARTAGAAAGDRPFDEEMVRSHCDDIPPELLDCVRPESEQTQSQQHVCRSLLGQSSFLESDPERSRLPRPRSEDAIRRALGRPSQAEEEAEQPRGPRERPARVE